MSAKWKTFSSQTKVYSSMDYTIRLCCIAALSSEGCQWLWSVADQQIVWCSRRQSTKREQRVDKKGWFSNKRIQKSSHSVCRRAPLTLHSALLHLRGCWNAFHNKAHEQNRRFSLLKQFLLYSAFRFTAQMHISRADKWRDKHAVP